MEKPDQIIADFTTAQWKDLTQCSPDTALQQAGLNQRRFTSDSIELLELTGTALISIQCLQPFESIRSILAEDDIPLPARVNEVLGQDPAVIGMAPGEWLLFSEFLRSTHLIERLKAVMDTGTAFVFNQSAGLAVFRLTGTGSAWLLNKLGGLDFQRGSTVAQCARTRLQQAAVCIHFHRPGHTNKFVFDLIFDRSIATYMWDLLIASAPHAEELNQDYGNHS